MVTDRWRTLRSGLRPLDYNWRRNYNSQATMDVVLTASKDPMSLKLSSAGDDLISGLHLQSTEAIRLQHRALFPVAGGYGGRRSLQDSPQPVSDFPGVFRPPGRTENLQDSAHSSESVSGFWSCGPRVLAEATPLLGRGWVFPSSAADQLDPGAGPVRHEHPGVPLRPGVVLVLGALQEPVGVPPEPGGRRVAAHGSGRSGRSGPQHGVAPRVGRQLRPGPLRGRRRVGEAERPAPLGAVAVLSGVRVLVLVLRRVAPPGPPRGPPRGAQQGPGSPGAPPPVLRGAIPEDRVPEGPAQVPLGPQLRPLVRRVGPEAALHWLRDGVSWWNGVSESVQAACQSEAAPEGLLWAPGPPGRCGPVPDLSWPGCSLCCPGPGLLRNLHDSAQLRSPLHGGEVVPVPGPVHPGGRGGGPALLPGLSLLTRGATAGPPGAGPVRGVRAVPPGPEGPRRLRPHAPPLRPPPVLQGLPGVLPLGAERLRGAPGVQLRRRSRSLGAVDLTACWGLGALGRTLLVAPPIGRCLPLWRRELQDLLELLTRRGVVLGDLPGRGPLGRSAELSVELPEPLLAAHEQRRLQGERSLPAGDQHLRGCWGPTGRTSMSRPTLRGRSSRPEAPCRRGGCRASSSRSRWSSPLPPGPPGPPGRRASGCTSTRRSTPDLCQSSAAGLRSGALEAGGLEAGPHRWRRCGSAASGPLSHGVPGSERGCWGANIQHWPHVAAAAAPPAGGDEDLLYFQDFPHIMAEGCVRPMEASRGSRFPLRLSLYLGAAVEEPPRWGPGLPCGPGPGGGPGPTWGPAWGSFLFHTLPLSAGVGAAGGFLSARRKPPCRAAMRPVQSWVILSMDHRGKLHGVSGSWSVCGGSNVSGAWTECPRP
ncbi:hypothetical protein EYF80_057204 [Liparis tanakae]|uniref:Uncharacterized protein n=1 Tax=Liparis tanakae TaxID=230148 RepID=A0A4Z2EUV3_9TELE|nr:hypothetical protein EYF80_057204 [Liparis tanakae]